MITQPKSWEKRGLSLQLIPWVGTNVMFLTTSANLDPDLMAKWVSRLDAGWRLYADLTGRKPNPFRQFEGKVTIAAVPGADVPSGACARCTRQGSCRTPRLSFTSTGWQICGGSSRAGWRRRQVLRSHVSERVWGVRRISLPRTLILAKYKNGLAGCS